MNEDTLTVTKTFTEKLLGGMPPDDYFAYLIWAVVGFIVSLLHELIRGQENIKASGGFSIAYYWKENWMRLVLSLLLINIGIVFYNRIFPLPTSTPLCTFLALMLGFSHDKIMEMLNKLRKAVRK